VKLVPVRVTTEPTTPEFGEMAVRVGATWLLVTVKETTFEVPFTFVTVTAYSPAGIYTPAHAMVPVPKVPVPESARLLMTGGGQEVRMKFSVVPFEDFCGEFTLYTDPVDLFLNEIWLSIATGSFTNIIPPESDVPPPSAKPVPVMVMAAPCGPEVGEIEVIVGGVRDVVSITVTNALVFSATP
jgi:hypothetical protein